MNASSRGIDRWGVTFDEPTLVADAGLIVPATLMVRLGLEALVNEVVVRLRTGWGPGPTGVTARSSPTRTPPDRRGRAFHRRHATVELAIWDLKEGRGRGTAPRGGSSPTPPGSPAACSPTIWCGGPPGSAAITSLWSITSHDELCDLRDRSSVVSAIYRLFTWSVGGSTVKKGAALREGLGPGGSRSQVLFIASHIPLSRCLTPSTIATSNNFADSGHASLAQIKCL